MISPPINEKEFASIIKQHSGIINKVSYFYASPKMPFDDLRQEIYVNIWLGLEQFRNDSKISTWIYRVAVNSALMALRSSKSKVKTVSLDFGLLDISSEIDDVQRENLQTLRSLIDKLEDIEKAIQDQQKEEIEEIKVVSPYTTTVKKENKVLKTLLIFVVILVLVLIALWAIKQITIANKTTNLIGYVIK